METHFLSKYILLLTYIHIIYVDYLKVDTSIQCKLGAQSSLNSIFAQNYLRKCKDTYFILQNKYLCIDEDNFGAKILRDDCTLSKCVIQICNS